MQSLTTVQVSNLDTLKRLIDHAQRQSTWIRDLASGLEYRDQIAVVEDLERVGILLDDQINQIHTLLKELAQTLPPQINQVPGQSSRLTQVSAVFQTMRRTHQLTMEHLRIKREQLLTAERRWGAILLNWLTKKFGGK